MIAILLISNPIHCEEGENIGDPDDLKLAFQNVQGIKNDMFKRENICEFIQQEDIHFMGLCETNCNEENLRNWIQNSTIKDSHTSITCTKTTESAQRGQGVSIVLTKSLFRHIQKIHRLKGRAIIVELA